MGVLMSMILPVWSQSAKREREAELIFRGEQYARAIELYQRRYVGAHPPDLETLVDERFLRRLYEDPMSEDGEFKVVYQSEADEVQAGTAATGRAGERVGITGEPSSSPDQDGSFSNPNRFGSRPTGGVVGVVSTSDESSLRIYNGQEKYSEWAFVYTPSSTDPAAVAGSGNTTGTGAEIRRHRGTRIWQRRRARGRRCIRTAGPKPIRHQSQQVVRGPDPRHPVRRHPVASAPAT